MRTETVICDRCGKSEQIARGDQPSGWFALSLGSRRFEVCSACGIDASTFIRNEPTGGTPRGATEIDGAAGKLVSKGFVIAGVVGARRLPDRDGYQVRTVLLGDTSFEYTIGGDDVSRAGSVVAAYKALALGGLKP